MLNMQDSERVRIIELRILREISEYYKAHSIGIQMHILSVKYARALAKLGGFPERIVMLENLGLVHVEVTESGARNVFPANKTPKVKKSRPASDYY